MSGTMPSKKNIDPLDRFPLNMQQAIRLLSAVALRRHAELSKGPQTQNGVKAK